VICIKKVALFAEMGWTLKPGHGHYNDVIQIKGLFKCLEMHSIIQCVDAISTESGSKGGTYRIASFPFLK